MAAGASPLSKCDVVHGVAGNAYRPIERLFTAIRKGDTPQSNQIAKRVHEWAASWLARMRAAFNTAGDSGKSQTNLS